jgi:hypothetical protein
MGSSHEGTDSDKRLAEALSVMLLGLVTECRRCASLSGKVLAVLAGVRRLGLELVRLALEEQDQPFRRRQVEVRCPSCRGLAHKAKGLKQRQRYTLMGKVTYRRCRYQCLNCREVFFPLDDELDLQKEHRGHSREFVAELVLLCTVVPYEKGGELFARAYGFAVSHTLAWQLTFEIGTGLYRDEMTRAQERWDERLTNPEKFEPTAYELGKKDRARRIYVMTDNSKLGMQLGKRGRKATKRPPGAEPDSWRDARALLIFREADRAENSTGKRRYILRRRVVAHIGEKEEWYRLVHLALYEEGVYWAHEVVVVADGGTGIWEMVAELLPSTDRRRVVEILDWYHATSHLWKVGRLLKGVKKDGHPPARCRDWVQGLVDYLERGEIGNVLQRLRKIKGGSAEARDELRKLIDYFDDHRERMHYAAFRKDGMLIGSGAVESVHKWVIQARCRLPGMRWSLAGANAMLRLRCAWASGRWDDVFRSSRSAPASNPAEPRLAA